LQDKALQTIKEALENASKNRKYLVSQLEKFKKGHEGLLEVDKRRISDSDK